MFKKLPLSRSSTNCYIIADDNTKEAAVIDPAGEFELIRDFIENNKLDVKYILLTHGHGDHIGALRELRAYSKAPVGIHASDESMLNNASINYSFMFSSNPIEEKSDFHPEDGEAFKLGASEFKILHTPGHTMGSIGILFGKDLISGDTLFARGIGRTDLPGGDYESIIKSISTKLFTLPEDIAVHPGHGGSSTIGAEKANNPFFK